MEQGPELGNADYVLACENVGVDHDLGLRGFTGRDVVLDVQELGTAG